MDHSRFENRDITEIYLDGPRRPPEARHPVQPYVPPARPDYGDHKLGTASGWTASADILANGRGQYG